MGDIIRAVCPCGLTSKKIYRGIGFRYFETGHFSEPAYCDTCGRVEGKGVRKGLPECSSCLSGMRFYHEALNNRGEVITEECAFSPYLEQQERWHCPKCQQETLEFEKRGCWD